MIRKTTLWALRALLYLAGRPAEHLALAAEVAAAVGAPRGTMTKVLQRLSLSGMVVSVRGAHGGYLLAESPTDIGLLRVLQAMQDPLTEVATAGEPGTSLARLDDLLADARIRALECLEPMTIADLAGAGREGQAT